MPLCSYEEDLASQKLSVQKNDIFVANWNNFQSGAD